METDNRHGTPGKRRLETAAAIPVYNPEPGLKPLCERLLEFFPVVLIIDDGSVANTEMFHTLPKDARLISYTPNRGKGAAIKTALRIVADEYPDVKGVVFADGDGQHAIEDIAGVAEMMEKEDSAVFGVRDFSGASVPFRSRFGNAATRLAVFMLCGIRLKDTQTGLRAFPKRLLAEMAAIKGDRYEYETIQIGVLRTLREKILQRPIHTIYIDGNRASHFRPFVDSFRVYAGLAGTTLGRLARFSASSLAAFAIDNAVFTALFLFAQRAGATRDLSIAASIAAARIVSATSNFFLNRKLVFRSGAGKAVSFARYTILALAIMGASCCGTSAISNSLDLQGTLVTAAKIVVETILFAVSYKVQKNWVFRDSRK